MLDGNIFRVWNSIRLAGNTLKIANNSISECCSRKRNTAGGWCWMYYEDYIEQEPDEEWREIDINSQKFRVSFLGMVHLNNGLITKESLHAGYAGFTNIGSIAW